MNLSEPILVSLGGIFPTGEATHKQLLFSDLPKRMKGKVAFEQGTRTDTARHSTLGKSDSAASLSSEI